MAKKSGLQLMFITVTTDNGAGLTYLWDVDKQKFFAGSAYRDLQNLLFYEMDLKQELENIKFLFDKNTDEKLIGECHIEVHKWGTSIYKFVPAKKSVITKIR